MDIMYRLVLLITVSGVHSIDLLEKLPEELKNKLSQDLHKKLDLVSKLPLDLASKLPSLDLASKLPLELPDKSLDPDTAAYILDPVKQNVKHFIADHPPAATPGIWRKKTLWKPRYVKEWRPSKTYKPVWRKIWGPIEIHEWIPIPKPPPPKDEPLKTVEIHSTSPIWKVQHPDTVYWPYPKPLSEEIELHSVEHEDANPEYGPPNNSSMKPPKNDSNKIITHKQMSPRGNSSPYHVSSSNPENKPVKVIDDMSNLLMPPALPATTPRAEEIYFTTKSATERTFDLLPASTVNSIASMRLSPVTAVPEKSTARPLALTEVRFVKEIPTVAPVEAVSEITRVSGKSRTTDKPQVFIVTPITTT